MCVHDTISTLLLLYVPFAASYFHQHWANSTTVTGVRHMPSLPYIIHAPSIAVALAPYVRSTESRLC